MATIEGLAKLFKLNIRYIRVGDNIGYQLGERAGGPGSYGLDAVVSYDTWNDRWSGRGGLTLPKHLVALYVAEWRKEPDAHPDVLANRIGLDRWAQ